MYDRSAMSIKEALWVLLSAAMIVTTVVMLFKRNYDTARWTLAMWGIFSIKADIAMFKGAVEMIIEEEDK